MTNKSKQPSRGLQTPPEVRAYVEALVRSSGTTATAVQLGVSVHTVLRLASGLDVLAGTLALIREARAREERATA